MYIIVSFYGYDNYKFNYSYKNYTDIYRHICNIDKKFSKIYVSSHKNQFDTIHIFAHGVEGSQCMILWTDLVINNIPYLSIRVGYDTHVREVPTEFYKHDTAKKMFNNDMLYALSFKCKTKNIKKLIFNLNFDIVSNYFDVIILVP